MGIPKYFRYVAERWPTMLQLVNDSVIPEFDNLYLDMNAIFHVCTHGNGSVGHLTEQEMFVSIFSYIDHLFCLVRPKKVLYLAVDGVAPRAKLNQQRSRRFRSALDAEMEVQAAIARGDELPKEDPFDRNTITPGTEFMERLSSQLRYFVSRKVTEDSDWKGIRVILSGHEVPGEGEHKIMNFIRELRASPGYSHNTRHCMYGLDADLIMLGLSTHEPHFALLREEVLFGPKAKEASNTELPLKRFYLLHLSLTREYIQLEFNSLLKDESFAYDFERILDDFILINIFVGNDFLPELPNLFINTGAIPLICDSYREYLIETKTYITHNGIIDYKSLSKWLKRMSAFHIKEFETASRDSKWYNQKLDEISPLTDNKDDENLILTPELKEVISKIEPFVLKSIDFPGECMKLTDLTDSQVKVVSLLASQTKMTFSEVVDDEIGKHYELKLAELPKTTEQREQWRINANKVLTVYDKAKIQNSEELLAKKQVYADKYAQWRDKYYRAKFRTTHDSDIVKNVCHNYLDGLQWVIAYYYNGCPSWSWHFRYHYAPMISDLVDNLPPDFEVRFEMSAPLLPLQQLMAVLPDRSKQLLPPVYRDLMTDEASPIIHFYPHNFSLDKNGKKNDWEAVVKIPFIDVELLKQVLATRDEQLSDSEKARNVSGVDIEFVFNPQVDFYYTAPSNTLPDIVHCKCQFTPMDVSQLEPKDFVYGRLKDSEEGPAMLAGFPTLKTLDYDFNIETTGNIKIFERKSRNDSIVIKVKKPQFTGSLSELSHELLGTSIYIGYPFLREARVIALSDTNQGYYAFDSKGRVSNSLGSLTNRLEDIRIKSLRSLVKAYSEHGIELGPVRIAIHYQLLRGLARESDGSYRKEFDDDFSKHGVIPFQLVVLEVDKEDERFKEIKAKPIEEEYPIGEHILTLIGKFYGSPAKILGHRDRSKMNIEIIRQKQVAEHFIENLLLGQEKFLNYRGINEISSVLKLSPKFVSIITSALYCTFDEKKYNLGLSLKFTAQDQKAAGYARYGLRSWELSERAVVLLRNYYRKFASILKPVADYLISHGSNRTLELEPILGCKNEGDKKRLSATLKEMVAWIREATRGVQVISCTDEVLTDEVLSELENFSQYLSEQDLTDGVVEVQNLPKDAVLEPAHAHMLLRQQTFQVGDRVVCAVDYGAVPLHNYGTVAGIITGRVYTSLCVIWDKEFDAATTLRGKLKTKRGLSVNSVSVLNVTRPQLVYGDVKETIISLQQTKTGHKSLPDAKSGLMPASLPKNTIWSSRNLMSKSVRVPVMSQDPSLTGVTGKFLSKGKCGTVPPKKTSFDSKVIKNRADPDSSSSNLIVAKEEFTSVTKSAISKHKKGSGKVEASKLDKNKAPTQDDHARIPFKSSMSKGGKTGKRKDALLSTPSAKHPGIPVGPSSVASTLQTEPPLADPHVPENELSAAQIPTTKPEHMSRAGGKITHKGRNRKLDRDTIRGSIVTERDNFDISKKQKASQGKALSENLPCSKKEDSATSKDILKNSPSALGASEKRIKKNKTQFTELPLISPLLPTRKKNNDTSRTLLNVLLNDQST